MQKDDDYELYNVAGQMVSTQSAGAGASPSGGQELLVDNYVDFHDVALVEPDERELQLIADVRAATKARTEALARVARSTETQLFEEAHEHVAELQRSGTELQNAARALVQYRFEATARSFESERAQINADLRRTALASDLSTRAAVAQTSSLVKRLIQALQKADTIRERRIQLLVQDAYASAPTDAPELFHVFLRQYQSTARATYAAQAGEAMTALRAVTEDAERGIAAAFERMRDCGGAYDYAGAISARDACLGALARLVDEQRSTVVQLAEDLHLNEAQSIWMALQETAAHPLLGFAVAPGSPLAPRSSGSAALHTASPASGALQVPPELSPLGVGDISTTDVLGAASAARGATASSQSVLGAGDEAPGDPALVDRCARKRFRLFRHVMG